MIVLIAYASLAAPRLPENIVRMFDHPLTKLVVFFLIVYLAKYNAGVAIVAAVAVLVTESEVNVPTEVIFGCAAVYTVPATNAFAT